MPQNTPRGYTYPLYTDPADFPAQMQDLAQDVDADVQNLINTQALVEDASSARVSGSGAVALTPNADHVVAFTTEEYDNDNMVDLGVNASAITFPAAGVYLVSGYARFASNADSTLSGRMIWLVRNNVVVLGRHSIRAGVDATPDSIAAELSLTQIINVPIAGQAVELFVRHSLPVNLNLLERNMSATKISEN